jgi:predicted nucleotidyltransferase
VADRVLTLRPPSREDPILEEVAQRLAEACHADRIYLFGSTARGEAGPDSDYDIMLIVPDDASREVLSGNQPREAVRDLKFFGDIVVYTSTYFDERLHLKASLPATVVREGKLLYGQEKPLSEIHVKPADRAKETATWLQLAKDDLARVDMHLTPDPPDVKGALFFCQQAAEKALKGFLMWCDVPFHKVHEMKELGEQCVAQDPTLADLATRIDKLTAYAFRFRYPGASYEPSLEEGQAALSLARETYDAVLSRVPPEARPD